MRGSTTSPCTHFNSIRAHDKNAGSHPPFAPPRSWLKALNSFQTSPRAAPGPRPAPRRRSQGAELFCESGACLGRPCTGLEGPTFSKEGGPTVTRFRGRRTARTVRGSPGVALSQFSPQNLRGAFTAKGPAPIHVQLRRHRH